VQQRERQRVPDGEHPCEPSGELHLLAQRHDQRVGPDPYDYLYAEVRNTSGALLGTLATYTNANATTPGNYAQRSFSLASWRGQTVRVHFRATTDFSLPTSFRIDDVSLR
jgi:hypothetical protein